MKFKIGDKIRVIDCGQTFDTYGDFFNQQRIAKYKFISGTLPKNGQLGVITHIGQHIWVGYGDLCVVKINEVDYIIEARGLELVENSKNLIPLIAKELGVEIGEEFNIVEGFYNPYRFSETDLLDRDGSIALNSLRRLLNGEFNIEKLPQKPKLTEDEKAILRNIPKEYKYIARDSSGLLYIYENKPKKDGGNVWFSYNYNYFDLFQYLFQFIKWEDEEPYNIEELLEEYQ